MLEVYLELPAVEVDAPEDIRVVKEEGTPLYQMQVRRRPGPRSQQAPKWLVQTERRTLFQAINDALDFYPQVRKTLDDWKNRPMEGR